MELQRELQREGVDVNLRTIQRDLNALAEQFPLETDGASPQGWRWQANAPLTSLPHMTSGQALTFMMVEQHLKTLMPGSVLDELRPWFDTARRQVRQGKSRVHRWADMVRIVPPTQPLIPPVIDRDVLHVIQEALLLGQRVDVLYQSRSKKENLNLDIDPLALVQRGPVLYLIATRPGAHEVRLFAMHRFQKAWSRNEKAHKPKGFVLDEFLAKGGLGFGNGKLKALKVVLNREVGEHLYESRLSEDQVIRELPDGRLEVTATVADTPQLEWWLRAMGRG
ncbi:helix-turn-helix transcriptional regulator [Alcanivorax sp. S71-1-4]|uniref:helix-turn-helix transcriptional regulator n=1 Tax=Alcanivorax sp. S71-1-4 TaxID=1177159 RepID=UPI001357BDBF|nr:WYL domain-containing protein [Alcanivorax sp. S71-1-4]